MPSLSIPAISAGTLSVVNDDDAHAANRSAPGDPDHADTGDSGPRPARQASQIVSDDDGEDDEDQSEADEEEEARLGPIETIQQRLKAKQQKWMDARRDPIQEWREHEKWNKEHEAYRVAAALQRQQEATVEEEKQAEKERSKRRKNQQRVTRHKARELRETLYQYELDVVKSEKRTQVITKFQREDHQQRKQVEAEADEARRKDEEQIHKQHLVAALAHDQQINHEAISALMENVHVAEEIGRRFGVLPAIDTPPARVVDEQDETATVLILRLNPIENTPLSPSPTRALSPARGAPSLSSLAAKRLFFTVNFKRFKHVENIKGEAIGDQGGVELARSLLTGACPRVKTIYLGWNHIKYSAVVALADCFVRGACGQLVTLDLRFNSIDANGIAHFLRALDQGALPELHEIVLQGNLLGDEGAKALAHAMLRGTLKLIRVLDIRQNRIRNAGILALWNVFTAECALKCCPKLQRLDMRRNEAQGALTRSFCPCPPYLEF